MCESNLIEIHLKDIDLKDDTFRMRLRGPDDCLLNSIERVGLINPPWVQPRVDSGEYRIVMGFRRVLALRELGQDSVMVRIVEEDDFDEVGLMETVILENLAHGPFDPVEISGALVRLRVVGVPDEEIIGRYMPLMGLKGDGATLDRYRSLMSLPEDIAEAISRGEVKMDSVGRVMRRFGGEDGEEILRLIRDMRLGVNLQRELITLLDEIIRRDEVSISQVLNRKEVSSLLRDESSNVPQKTQALISVLRRIRFPQTMELVDRVKERVEGLGLDPAVALELSPYLEEKRMRVSFGFRSREEYQKILESLTALGKGGEVDELMEDLFGKRSLDRGEQKE